MAPTCGCWGAASNTGKVATVLQDLLQNHTSQSAPCEPLTPEPSPTSHNPSNGAQALADWDKSQDSQVGKLPKRVDQPTMQHRYLFEEDGLSRSTHKLFHSTKSSGSTLEEKSDQCKCENLIMFQNLANEVRKLTQCLEEMAQRMEALENLLKYRWRLEILCVSTSLYQGLQGKQFRAPKLRLSLIL